MACDTDKIKDMVRTFSFELEEELERNGQPSDALSNAVVQDRKREDRQHEVQEWRKYFESLPVSDDDEIAKLDHEGNILSAAWAEFHASLPTKQRVELSHRAQNWTDVIAVVQNAESEWKAKKQEGAFGRAKRTFNQVCSTIHRHSTMLEVLPSSSEYASVNYQKIAEGLSKALLEINDIVAAVNKETLIYPTTAMQHVVANLYAHIFLFLKEVMAWYTKRSHHRLLSSFREDFYEHFEDHIRIIREISWSINREAQASSMAEGRYTRLMVEDLAQMLSSIIGSEGRRREEAQARFERAKASRQLLQEGERTDYLKQERNYILDQFKQIMSEEQLGVAATGMLRQQAQTYIQNGSGGGDATVTAKTIGAGTRESLANIGSSLDSQRRPSGPQSREEIEFISRALEDLFSRADIRIRKESETEPVFFADNEIVSTLKDWTTDASGAILCISGPNEVARPSSTSLLASQYAAYAEQAGVPVISHFCSLPRKSSQSSITLEMISLASLLCSLIRQLVELLPLELPPNSPRLDSDRFARLNGTVESLSDAMSLLQDLISVAPPLLLFIIDGIQWLDDKTTEKHIRALVSLLRKCSSPTAGQSSLVNTAPPSTQTIKVLFTTSGKSRALIPILERHELLLADRISNARTPGRASPGRIPLSPFTPPRPGAGRRTSSSPLASKGQLSGDDNADLNE
ncbi:hypothetical protein NA57DRAFT_70292 [Rhizodiscina lignyota]|uniref:DUF7708 domain-containing protein n=1 Tax=Rhizodiscina lignyota TaxID=1504668 RepID=A0A9P4MAW0_9PEZI|nr:hypothetical protein NA57DRAFT_70292 [Rhizodiscina lignyota]